MSSVGNSITVADTPWHGVATVVEGAMTAEEAIERADLDWEVELRPLAHKQADGTWKQIEGRFATVRPDLEQYLGLVGGDYQTLNNRDAFAFCTPMATMGAAFDSVGSLDYGRKLFLTMKLERQMLEEDPHDIYLFMFTSHDGTKSVEPMVTPIRRRCTNQDALIVATAQMRWRIRHLSTMHEKLIEAQDTLKKTFQYVESFEEVARRLMSIDLEQEQFAKYLRDVLPETKRQHKMVDAVLSAREHSTLLDDIRPTAWGALQAWTEWTDHRRPYRRPETKLKTITDGWAFRYRNDLAQRFLNG